MADLHEVLRIVAGSGFVMKERDRFDNPAGPKVETVHRDMYHAFTGKPFYLNRLMRSLKIRERLIDDYRTAFNKMRDVAILCPVSGVQEYVKR